jgi:hypothetical protein
MFKYNILLWYRSVAMFSDNIVMAQGCGSLQFNDNILYFCGAGVWQCSVTASSFRSRDALVSDEAKLVGEYPHILPYLFIKSHLNRQNRNCVTGIVLSH